MDTFPIVNALYNKERNELEIKKLEIRDLFTINDWIRHVDSNYFNFSSIFLHYFVTKRFNGIREFIVGRKLYIFRTVNLF